ncbi:hypothetical protein [Oxynema sp. CENA135]|uniref:hypothetical protein n=1 Tax=Oxynema sp. CENA135 TaxID=984206 RepID=UPI001F207964|nr:hypothetical protein [Oxynema sp. CENA135]
MQTGYRSPRRPIRRVIRGIGVGLCGVILTCVGIGEGGPGRGAEPIPAAPTQLYRAIAPWSGRLILPEPSVSRDDGGVYLEVENAPGTYRHLIGERVWLTWHPESIHQGWLERATVDLEFDETTRESMEKGNVHPTRLNGRSRVSPLESLAGGRSRDNVRVELDVRNVERQGEEWVLQIGDEPIQIAGIDRALIQFIEPVGDRRYRVRHYDPSDGRFDAALETIALPDAGTVIPGQGVEQSSIDQIERSPLNAEGWYIYGRRDDSGTFNVEALQPAALYELDPSQMAIGRAATREYILDLKWETIPIHAIETTLLDNNGAAFAGSVPTPSFIERRTRELWSVGDVALVLHTFGWRGGERGDPPILGLVTGHFAFGFAEVVRDEFTGKLRFDVVYRQVYAHNREGIVAGAMRSELYLGSLERGWMYTLPISDVMVRLPELTVPYQMGDRRFDPLTFIKQELALMEARYRTGPGNGASVVTPAVSCVKDANQALYGAIVRLRREVLEDPEVREWLRSHPDRYHTRRFRRLERLLADLEHSVLLPLGYIPKNWQRDERAIAIYRDGPGVGDPGLLEALKSWKTMLPRRAERELLQVFARHGATMVDVQFAELGGEIPGIEPQPPTTIF